MPLTTKTKILNSIRNLFKWKPLEAWLQKNTVNKALTSMWGKLPPNHYQYPPKSLRTACVNGINYELDISHFNDWSVYFGLQEQQRERLLGLAEKGNTILDVGTNIGAVSLPFAQTVGRGGKVISFEPHPITHQKLLKNLSLNDFPQVIPIQKGLGDAPATFTISTIDEHNPGRNRILSDSKTEEFEVLEQHQIEVDTLDRVVAELGLEQVDLIKIDVEGFELKVLQGATHVLSEFDPKLFIELDDKHLQSQGGSAKALIVFLEERGYELFEAAEMKKVTSKMNFKGCHFDVLASIG